MVKSKTKIAAIFGAVSASLGGAGAVIAGLGLCACILAPLFSVIGIASLIMGFLSDNSPYFLAIGTAFLVSSFILYEKKQTCKVHKK